MCLLLILWIPNNCVEKYSARLYHFFYRTLSTPVESKKNTPKVPKWMMGIACGFFLLQLLIPLRPLLDRQNNAWTKQGHYFGWRMRLYTLEYEFQMSAFDENDQIIDLTELTTVELSRNLLDTLTHPYGAMRAAQYLEKELISNYGYSDPKIYVYLVASLSNRKYQYLIDPTVDLTQVKYSFLSGNEWVNPDPDKPLPTQWKIKE